MYPSGTLLFNLDRDLAESRDVSDENPAIVSELSALYRGSRVQMSDPVRRAAKNR